MSDKLRAATLFCAQGLPTAAVTIATASLAPFGTIAGACLAVVVGASTWASTLRRKCPLMAASRSFIGS